MIFSVLAHHSPISLLDCLCELLALDILHWRHLNAIEHCVFDSLFCIGRSLALNGLLSQQFCFRWLEIFGPRAGQRQSGERPCQQRWPHRDRETVDEECQGRAAWWIGVRDGLSDVEIWPSASSMLLSRRVGSEGDFSGGLSEGDEHRLEHLRDRQIVPEAVARSQGAIDKRTRTPFRFVSGSPGSCRVSFVFAVVRTHKRTKAQYVLQVQATSMHLELQ